MIEGKNTIRSKEDLRNHTLYLAPLQGVTSHIFRSVFFRHVSGFDAAVLPFIPTVRGRLSKEKCVLELRHKSFNGCRQIPQLLGNDPLSFVACANMLCEQYGYETVNLNLGCPSPTVVNKGRGCAVLPNPELLRAFFDTALPRLKPALSLKTRLGLQSPDEILRCMPIFNDYPLCEIIIHARTGRDGYSGVVDTDSFARCTNLSKHRLVYNGDITDVDVFRKRRRQFPGIRAWMLGRGAIANPFLAEEIRGSQIPQQQQRQRFMELYADLYTTMNETLSGSGHVLGVMKELWSYFENFFPESERFVRKLRTTTSRAIFERRVEEFFQNKLT